jgi:hypothetical protein
MGEMDDADPDLQLEDRKERDRPHPSVFMGGPSAQSKRTAGYLLRELAALVGALEGSGE